MKYLAPLLLLFTWFCRADPLPQYCPKPMTMVFYGDWYPYMFEQGDGYKGIDYEFMARIFDELGCHVDVISLPERRAHQDLARGDSLVMSGATITHERQRHAYFSKPYRGETMSLFYLSKSDSEKASASEVIKGSSMIAINGAAYYGPFIEDFRHNDLVNKFQHVPSLQKRVEMLERLRADAMVEDHIAGCYYIFSQRPSLSNRVKWIRVNQVEVAFMFSKGVVSPEFITIFNRTMQQLIKQGIYDEIAAQYTPKGC